MNSECSSWQSHSERPCIVTQGNSAAKENSWSTELKSTEAVLLFPKIEAIESAALICFSDASFGNLKCGGSQGGLCL